jgi:hypothetical protein
MPTPLSVMHTCTRAGWPSSSWVLTTTRWPGRGAWCWPGLPARCAPVRARPCPPGPARSGAWFTCQSSVMPPARSAGSSRWRSVASSRPRSPSVTLSASTVRRISRRQSSSASTISPLDNWPPLASILAEVSWAPTPSCISASRRSRSDAAALRACSLMRSASYCARSSSLRCASCVASSARRRISWRRLSTMRWCSSMATHSAQPAYATTLRSTTLTQTRQHDGEQAHVHPHPQRQPGQHQAVPKRCSPGFGAAQPRPPTPPAPAPPSRLPRPTRARDGQIQPRARRR